jgi:transcriptional regulator with XRE-family HTH domain
LRGPNRLREIRFDRGLNQLDLAARAGCSVSLIVDIERRGWKPQEVTREKLATALGCTPDDIWPAAAAIRDRALPQSSAGGRIDPALEPELAGLVDSVVNLVAAAWRARQLPPNRRVKRRLAS